MKNFQTIFPGQRDPWRHTPKSQPLVQINPQKNNASIFQKHPDPEPKRVASKKSPMPTKKKSPIPIKKKKNNNNNIVTCGKKICPMKQVMFDTPNQKTNLCQNFEETMMFKTWLDLEQKNMLERETWERERNEGMWSYEKGEEERNGSWIRFIIMEDTCCTVWGVHTASFVAIISISSYSFPRFTYANCYACFFNDCTNNLSRFP